MNGIERITQRISSDARKEADRILAAAREEAAAATERYRAQAEAERLELSERNGKAAAEREERLVSMAQMEARKLLLAARQEMVDKVYVLALERLCSMPEEMYIEVLANLMNEASSTGKEEVVFSARDKKAVGQKAVEKANTLSGKKLKLSRSTASIQGGFILRDRNIEVNCTFETLVRLEKPQTAGTVAKTLFA